MIKKNKPRLIHKLILFPFFILPRPVKKFVAYCWTCFWFYILRLRVKETTEQVQKVFPLKSKKEASKIVFDSFYNLILVIFEYSYLAFNKKHLFRHTDVRNLDLLNKALSKDRPVFLFTGHLANGEAILSRVCYEGYPLHLIAKRVGNSFLNSFLFDLREVAGLVHIPPTQALTEIIAAMKKKAPLVFLHDQFRSPPKGVASTFLGLPTYTNSSLASFALKNNALVLPVNMFREDERTVVSFEEEIPFEKKYKTDKENIAHMTQIYNDWLETKISKRPGEWMWIHRRWKKVRAQTKKLNDRIQTE